MKTRVIVLLAFIASAISFAKFSPCIGFNWATPGQYIHACYSDLPSLLGNRSIGSGIWAYSGDQPVEYPVITGLVMYVTAQIAQVTTTYYLYFLSPTKFKGRRKISSTKFIYLVSN